METLAARIEREGSLQEADAVGWAIRLARTVEDLHARGIVHGRLSAAGVRIEAEECTSAGELAALIDLPENVAYHSPERERGEGGSQADDTWAVAVVLYYALSGSLPFSGANDDEVRHKIRTVPAPPLAVFDVGDDDLQSIVDRSLARVRDVRVVAVAALREALENWQPELRLDELPPLHEPENDEEVTHVHTGEAADVIRRVLAQGAEDPTLRYRPQRGSKDAAAVIRAKALMAGDRAGASGERELGADALIERAATRLRETLPAVPAAVVAAGRALEPATTPLPAEPIAGSSSRAPQPAPPARAPTPPAAAPTPPALEPAAPAAPAAPALAPSASPEPSPASVKREVESTPVSDPVSDSAVDAHKPRSRAFLAAVAFGVAAAIAAAAYWLSEAHGLASQAPSSPSAGPAADPAPRPPAVSAAAPVASSASLPSLRASASLAASSRASSQGPHASRGPADLAACVAPNFPADSFDKASSFAALCATTDASKIGDVVRTELVRARHGVSEGMHDWALLGWYELATVALLRARCCPDAKPLDLPEVTGCPSMRGVLDELYTASAKTHDVDDKALRGALASFTSEVYCVVRLGHGQRFGRSDAPEGGQDTTFLRFLKRYVKSSE